MVKRLLEVLLKSKKAISFEKIVEKMGLTNPEEIFEVRTLLDDLIDSYEVYCTPNGNMKLMSKTSFKKGRFHKYKNGDGKVFVTISYENAQGEVVVKEEEYKIKCEDNNDAIDGDEVLIDVDPKDKSAKIVKIIKRNLNSIVGEVYREGTSYFVRSYDKKTANLIIALDGEHIEGQIVSVDLIDQRSDSFYIGEITRVFKHKDDPHEDALLEAFKCGMPEGFSKESMEQLQYTPRSVSEKDKEGRYDFTDWEVFSIDGKDTKDKDDCVSYKKLSNGNILLGVHIADVPYYVPENSPIDLDAFKKGTSYYFGGCVEPQLPHELSNGICSLHDNFERLTKTVLIEYDPQGNVVSRSLVRSVIKSRIGMTYESANKFFEDTNSVKDYEPYKDSLLGMKELARILRKKRKANGAIDFYRPELKFIYDDAGNPIDVTYRYQGISEGIIEELMLAGNVNVGEILEENGIPCIYRVHGVPNEERLTEFLKLLSLIGMPFDYSAEDICNDKHLLQLLTEHINKNEKLRDMLNLRLIRCMSHAKYSANNIGHYGTGFDIYIHFTSPIRRLADLGISRIIDECYFEEDPKKKERSIKKWKALAPEYAMQASKMERVEEDVERNVDAMNTAVYLSNFIGKEFEGTIIDIGQTSITIQLDNLLEGRVKTKSLPGNYYYDPEAFTLFSINGFDNYYIGDRLKLKLMSTDKEGKTVDFKVMEKVYDNKYIESDNTKQFVKTKDNKKRNRKRK